MKIPKFCETYCICYHCRGRRCPFSDYSCDLKLHKFLYECRGYIYQCDFFDNKYVVGPRFSVRRSKGSKSQPMSVEDLRKLQAFIVELLGYDEVQKGNQ